MKAPSWAERTVATIDACRRLASELRAAGLEARANKLLARAEELADYLAIDTRARAARPS